MTRNAGGWFYVQRAVTSFLTSTFGLANGNGIQARFESLLHKIFQDFRDLVSPRPASTYLLEVCCDKALLLKGVIQLSLGNAHTRAGSHSKEKVHAASSKGDLDYRDRAETESEVFLPGLQYLHNAV